MAVIPQNVQDFITDKLAWVATAAADGTPNVTPKGTLKIYDDEHIVFADLFSLKTRKNLAENPRTAVTVIDEKTALGYQLKGTAEMLSSGPLYDEIAEELRGMPMDLPPPAYVVRIHVDAIFDQSVGPNAGRQIA